MRDMVGRDMAHRYPDRDRRAGEVLFELQGWNVWHPEQRDRQMIRDLSMTVRAGEVVGIAGLMGSGRTELAMSVFGRSYGRNIAGQALVRGQAVDLSTVDRAIAAGLAYVTEDRKTLGLIEVARQVSEAGGVRADRAWLLSLPFVGDYIADAVLLYAFEQAVVPLDRNFQRVVHRVFFGQQPPRRYVEPYRDPETVYIVDEMTREYDAGALRAFHQGVLIVAWDFCRYHPRINDCPLRTACVFARFIGAG